MLPPSSTRSSARLANLVASATLVGLAALAVQGERAAACGGGDWVGISGLTTFDPAIVEEPEGLYFDPQRQGFGEGCTDCLAKAMAGDWQRYLGDAVAAADWQQVLLQATPAELTAIERKLARGGAAPKGYEASTIFKATAAKDKLRAALGVVQLARRIEPFATFEAYDPDGNPKPLQAPPADTVAAARAGLKTQDPFLAQRYAFQGLRATFYQRDWAGVVAFHDKHAGLLAAPSADLAFRARHYVAGALARNGAKARANLELAKIHANYPPLAPLAAQEFLPMEDKDWRESLRLAKTVREKTELWRLVGLKKDGLVAMQEIAKLDPKSSLIPLLLVREVEKAESRVYESIYSKPDPVDVAAQKKAFAALERFALDQLARTADRPWLYELVAGHIAAKRGDLATARTRLGRAAAAQPKNPRVASQVKASLAMGLVASWKMAPAQEEELATTMLALDPKFGRFETVKEQVRRSLAKAYAGAGKRADAEFLMPGTVDPFDASATKPIRGKRTWHEPAFIQEMIARSTRTTTAFDRFVVGGSFTRAQLEQELAMRYVLDGNFAAAGKLYAAGTPRSEKLGTDPFVARIVDCHDCDHQKYASSKWTHASFVAKLVELEARAKAGGEAGAEAALQLGNALYNITWYGNARVVLDPTHQSTDRPTAAMAWYKKAFELTKSRELKAKAAYLAAKAELGNLITSAVEADPNAWGYNVSGGLPVPTTWFPILRQYANTKYYKEVLRECGHFRTWAKAKP